MPINANIINCTNTLRSHGHQVWTTEGAVAPYVPYGGSYYTTLFYTTGGYQALMGRMWINLNISQQHQGVYDFMLSNYGGGIANRSTGAHNSYLSLSTPVIGAGESVRWTNTNGSSWGDGTLNITAIVWGAGSNHFNSGYPGLDDNFSSSQSGNFLHRAA